MSSRDPRNEVRLAPCLTVLLALVLIALAPPSEAGSVVKMTERVVAGSESDFLIARHLILRGSNFAIGKKLAEIARDRHGVDLRPAEPTRIRRVQRLYMERNFPIYHERMRGAAAAFSMKLEEDRADFDSLPYLLAPFGCSVVYYPPRFTADGVGYLSRNYDFTTGTIQGTRPAEGQLPCTARPYVLELHPDEGYSSLALCSYDLLGGVLDGINSEGLSVALLADDQLNRDFAMEPTRGPAVGLGVQHVLRMLLDTCADVEEAKQALLLNKQFYSYIPCHYIIADRHGDSFVFEYSQAHNKEYIVEGNGEPQITTNFSLHRHASLDDLPGESHPLGSFNRYRTLSRQIEKCGPTLTVEEIKHTNSCVMPTVPSPGSQRPLGRTLWHGVYCPEKRSLEVDFYLGEATTASGKTRIRRSGYLRFDIPRS